MKKRIFTALVCALAVSLSTVPAFAETGLVNFDKDVTYPGFTDVATSSWYYNHVKSACEYGMVKGYANGSFNPLGNVTLAEAITVASRMDNIYTGGTGEFDTTTSPWYKETLNYALRKEIVNKTSFADSLGSTDYTRPATKAELAFILSKVFPSTVYPAITGSSSIPDVSASTSYYHSIYEMYHAGVITGNESGYFEPTKAVSRAEFCTMVNRAIDTASRVKTY